MDDRVSRIASAFRPASVALRVAGDAPALRFSVLRKKFRKEKDRSEWALLDSKGKKVLRWFGEERPSEERVKKEEKRIQYFKHQGSRIAVTRMTYGVLPSKEEFDMAFALEQPDGLFRIRGPRGGPSSLPLADGDYSADELWDFMSEAVSEGDERKLSFVSDILSLFGFEWI